MKISTSRLNKMDGRHWKPRGHTHTAINTRRRDEFPCLRDVIRKAGAQQDDMLKFLFADLIHYRVKISGCLLQWYRRARNNTAFWHAWVFGKSTAPKAATNHAIHGTHANPNVWARGNLNGYYGPTPTSHHHDAA